MLEDSFSQNNLTRGVNSFIKGNPEYHIFKSLPKWPMDEYSAKTDRGNMKIWEEFCVRGYYHTYDGMNLLKHALHNTVPDIKKSIGKDDNGNDIKVPDSEAIQLANTKIDEIRNGFSEWLDAQSPEFKDRLVDLYNRIDTHGQYQRVGEVYGFPIAIISERVLDEGREKVQNRFVVEGNYKYKFKNGYIAMSDTHAACMNFVNALEKIPGIIAQYEERTAKLKADAPTLEGIMSKKWGKEEELKQLKSDLAALDRKIQAEIAPKPEEADGVENKNIEADRVEMSSTDAKKTMVAEPTNVYYHIESNAISKKNSVKI